MRDTKCITLLRTLSNRELGEFNKYLKSNYENKKPELQLLAFIKPFSPQYSSSKLTIDTALDNGLTAKGFTHTTVSSKLSSLYRLLKEFLLWKRISDHSADFEKEKMFLSILHERGIEDLFLKKVDKLIDLKKQEELNICPYVDLAKLEALKYFSNSDFKKIVRGNGLENIVENIDGFYIGAKLKYACEQMYQKKIVGKSYDPNLLKEVKSLAEQEPYKNDRLLTIFQSILDLGEHPNKQKYLEIKTLIMDAYQIEEKWEQSIMFGFLLNYLAGEIKRGESDYGTEAEEWISFGLKQNIIIENGYLHSTIFINLINIACSINKLKFAKEIIHNYQDKLKEEIKEKTIEIAKAYINFEENKFDAVIKHLNPITFPQKIMDLKARVIVLKSLYELNKTDDLLLYFDSFGKSIQRAKDLSPANKKGAQNLIKYTQKLLDPDVHLNNLEQEINGLDYIFGKMWLLQKIEGKKKK